MGISAKIDRNLRVMPTQIAVRYRKGRRPEVADALSVLGTVEEQPPRRLLIFQRAPGVSSREVNALVAWLEHRGAIDFASAVYRDLESGLRQVLTDEIVLRFKPGTAQRHALTTLCAEYGVTVCARNASEPAQYVVKVSDASGTNTLDVAHLLARCEQVEFARPNFLTELGKAH
jgi:hypothetical protein